MCWGRLLGITGAAGSPAPCGRPTPCEPSRQRPGGTCPLPAWAPGSPLPCSSAASPAPGWPCLQPALQPLPPLQVRDPKLRRVVDRSGSAAEIASLFTNEDRNDIGGFKALHLAVATGWAELVDKLLEVGAASASRHTCSLLQSPTHPPPDPLCCMGLQSGFSKNKLAAQTFKYSMYHALPRSPPAACTASMPPPPKATPR